MKYFLLNLCCLLVVTATAQKMKPYPSADSLLITGLVNNQIVLPLSAIGNMPDTSFSTMKILNHRGEFKVNYRDVKAVSLKQLLENKLLSTVKPKEMYGLYFVCKAMDGYTVVYSYNELFNDSPGIFIVTAYDGIDLASMPEKPMLLTLTGPATGKIGIRGIKSIEVRKAE